MKILGAAIPKELITPKNLLQDLFAGLTVAVMVVPQGMAYALLLGLPAIYGLYAAFVPLLVYPIFGSSRQLSVGPVALVTIIVLSGATVWADPGSPRYIDLVLLTSLIAGLIQVLLAGLRMGFLVNFLSEPVIVAFTTAAAFVIGLNQLKYVLGVDIPSANNVLFLLQDVFSALPDANIISVAIGVSAIAIILLLKKVHKRIPSAMVVVVIGTLLLYMFRWDQSHAISTVGHVPGGLPSFRLDFINYKDALLVTPLALVICLISFIESLAISKTIAKKNNYTIHPDKELLGLGIAKVAGAIFLGYPNTGSFTRSAINDDAGAKTGMSSVFAGLIVGLILLFLTPLFYFLPKAVLGAIVIAAVFSLVNVSYAKELYRTHKSDFLVYLTTLVLTLFMGIQEGVFVGIVMSLFMIVRRAATPHFAILGRLPGTNVYRNISRYPEAKIDEDHLVLRYDESIYFANANHFTDMVIKAAERYPSARRIVLHSGAINNVDSTGVHKIFELIDQLERKNIELLFAYLRGPVRDTFEKSGIADRLNNHCYYLTVQDAVEGIDENCSKSALSRKYASQGIQPN